MSTSAYDTILTSLDDGVFTITMNRPDRLNAWTYQMGAELQHAIETGNENPEVDVFILTGAGRGFCAGADIKDLFKDQADGGESAGDQLREIGSASSDGQNRSSPLLTELPSA